MKPKMLRNTMRAAARRPNRRFFSSNVPSVEVVLERLGINEGVNMGVYDGKWGGSGKEVVSHNPATGEPIASVKTGTLDDYESCVKAMDSAKRQWWDTPAPVRG